MGVQRRQQAQQRRVRVGAALVVAVVLAGMLPDRIAFAAPEDLGRPGVQRERSVPVTPVPIRAPFSAQPPLRQASVTAPVWPTPGKSTVDIAVAAGAARARAGALPVWLGAPERAATGDPRTGEVFADPTRVTVEVLDRSAAAVTARPLVLRMERADGVKTRGRLSVEVDFSGFRHAYGGDWASRLQLHALPDCALTLPDEKGCQGRALPTRVDLKAGRLVADADLSGTSTLFAVTAGASGNAGSFAASGLSPSSTWGAGGSTGDFTWSYPMRVPPGLGGPAPQVALSYSSGSVDGRTIATNNQPSWIGEGHEYWPGFVERRYKSCAHDGGAADDGDLCWGTDNAVMSLNGKSAELVKDSTTGVWRPRQDDGSKVDLIKDLTLANGDNDGEYWRITTTDGTRYYFGRHRLPGWTVDAPETHSTWTVPVFGNNTNEPCQSITYCDQAWRWNLDYVEDVNGHTMSYWYGKEFNHYGRNGDPHAEHRYVRGGTLKRIDYGSRAGAEYASPPTARVVFGSAERCLPNTACDPNNRQNWTDSPWDTQCDADPCTGKYTPTFWTSKRLSKVTTQVRDGLGYRDVDSWTFNHTYPDPGDGTRPGLWLESITHTGHVGTAVSLPQIKLTPEARHNRVASGDGRPTMNWMRLHVIQNESGGETRVIYSGPQCVVGGKMPATPDSNTLRCHPVKDTYPGEPNRLDWFHKYVVDEVVENDLTGGAPQTRVFYEYVGDAAWHFNDDDGLTPVDKKTWAEWRGYQTVRTRRGVAPDTPTYSETTYYRGMHGDKLANGGTRVAKVTDSKGVQVEDTARFAGMPREERTLLGPGATAPELSATVHEPWMRVTGTANHPWATVQSAVADVATTRSRSPKEDGGLQEMRVDKTFNDEGQPLTVNDHGDISKVGDERCTRFTYAQNTAGLKTPTSRVEVYAKPCGTAPAVEADIISDVRTYFDGSDIWNATPVRGNVTKTESIKTWTPSSRTYVTTSRQAYDPHGYGRIVESWDAAGERSTTSYEPETGGPLRAIEARNPLGHRIRTELEPAWGLPTVSVDANDRRTEMAYDSLGRLVAGWQAGRSRSQSPNVQYEYRLRGASAPTAVVTKSLRNDGSYTWLFEVYDGFLRSRQTQLPGPNGGRILADTVYNSLGQAWKQNGAYWNSAAPFDQLVRAEDAEVPGQNRTEFDAAGRAKAEVHYAFNVERWRTSKTYGGANRVDVTPPLGGTATTAIMDAQGRTTELRQYHASTPTGTSDVTTYQFDGHGRQTTITDAAGNLWQNTYDLRGRMIKKRDPDQGETELTYDDADRLLSTKDSEGRVLAFTYDGLGRMRTMRDGSVTGPKRAEWTYDVLPDGTPLRGLLTAATRWVGASAYAFEITAVDGADRPTASRVRLPDSAGFATEYASAFVYNADGTLAKTTVPAAGGLPAEELTFSYDVLGNPKTLVGAQTYVANTTYSELSEVGQLELGNPGKRLWLTYNYEIGTRRTKNIQTKREAAGAVQGNVTYDYDAIGNVTRIQDVPSAATGVPTDTQCFSYDYLRRLKDAWTPSGGTCGVAPTGSNVGGPAPYWTSYGYDKVGNRTSEVRHGFAGALDTTKTFTYPAAGQPQPHTLRSVTINDSAGTRTLNYGYDATGNTTTRPNAAGIGQALTWDPEGKLTRLVEGGNATEFVYDAGGNRLIRSDPDGTKTLYLGTQEIRVKNGQTTATRYYAHGTTTVAVRTNDGTLSWLSSDRLGTGQLAFTSTDLAVSRRRFTPFGEERGPAATWPGERGYVGGTKDPTGLTHLGAREYDALTGRFISIDPVVDVGDPQQMQGYAYAGNSPVSYSDPDGLRRMCPDGICDPMSPGDVGPTYKAPAPSDDEIKEAKKVREKKVLDVIIEAGGDVLMEVLGINDIRNCFTKGDVVACVSMAVGALPIGKLAKIPAVAKAIHRAYEGYKAFTRKLEWAKGVLSRAARASDEAADAVREGAEAGARQADEAGGAAGKTDDLNGAKGDSCPSSNSFVPGTEVLMADGSRKAIEDVRVGDEVFATDPETGSTDARPVTTTIVGDGAKVLVNVTVATGDGGATLTATDGHPFWVADRASWVDAADLRVGDELLSPDGARVRVIDVVAYGAQAAVHNLTVETAHTYHVVAGSTPVLAHNCGTGRAEIYLDPDAGPTGHMTIRITGEVDGVRFDLHTELIGIRRPVIKQVTDKPGRNTMIMDLPLLDAEIARDYVLRRLAKGDAGRYDPITNNCVTYVMSVLRAGGHYDAPANNSLTGVTWLWNKVGGKFRKVGD